MIVMFVLLMLFLFKYIDDLIGKGFELTTIFQLMLYASATNVFTVTPFKNGDPELSSYNGIYDGSGMEIPRTYTIGIKLDF